MEYIKRFNIPKDKNVLTPVIAGHQDLILLAMFFVRAYHQLLYAAASDRKPSRSSYRTRAPSAVTENAKTARYLLSL